MLTRRKLLFNGMRATVAAPATLLALGYAHPVAGSAQASPIDDERVRGQGSLKAHASAHGLFAGAAVNVKLLNDDIHYRVVLAEQYNMVVAEGEMKWKALRPAPDQFSFSLADAFVTFATRHKMRVRGHNFVWHEALPDWFAATVTPENARKFLVDHILTVGRRYQGRIHSWDVVNEAVLPKDGRPDGLRNSPWMKLLGPEYIDTAFRAAREADPHALLTYNEYGVEYDNDEDAERRDTTLKLLRRLKDARVPIDAVGIQSHIKAGSPYTIGKGVREFMASVRKMGLQIYVTELDVNEDDLPFDDVAHRDRAIAETYRQYLSAVLPEKAVKAVLTWGVSDNHTWLNDGPTHKRKQPNRPQRSLPFDHDYRPKEAFFAIRDCFDGRA
jgi:endo-1,4-beta-xylanase